MSFLAVFIAPVPFLYQRHRLCTHVMLIFILIDVQYLHNDAFSFEKGLIHQNHSLSSHNPIKKPPPPGKLFPFPYPFYLFRKPWSILGCLLFLLYMLLMICLRLTYYFYIQMTLVYIKLGKFMISLLMTSYPQTESKIEEKTTKKPWFLDCHQLLLSMFCRIVILSWASTLHRKTFCIVKYSILKQNYKTSLKLKIASYVYCRNKLVSHKKVSKVALQTSFLRIHVFFCNRNQFLTAFQSDRLILPVPHTSAIKITKIMQLLLI